MNFLSPAFLIGLPLIGVPVIIHLLSRRQRKRISWGAMQFLIQAATRRRRLWRLTDILLLLLRTFTFAFFIFALARPMLEATWLGESIPREVVLVLDPSMSMSRRVGATSLFDLQLEKANGVLDKLKTSDSVRVLLAGEAPEWLTPEAVDVNASAVRNLREQLAKLKPGLGAADLIRSVREAVDLEAPPEKAGRSILVFSDGQRFGWRMDERALWAAVQSGIGQAALPTRVGIQLLNTGESDRRNLCVNKVTSLRECGAVNQPMNFTAHVQNRSTTASEATLLTWRVNNQSIGVSTVPELAAGAATTVAVDHQFSSSGVADVACELETNDALPADNHGHWLVEAFDRLPVLLVEDASSSEPLETDAAFVLAALGARQASGATSEWRSVFEPAVIQSSAITTTGLNRFRCVILANLRNLAPAAVEKLESYARSSGGVWITLGPQTDATFFNDHFYRGGIGLAPMKITTPVGDADNREKFFALRTSSATHPATALLSDLQRLDLDRARVYRRHQFDAFSGKDVSVLMQVENGDSVVVERTFERGRVLVQAIPLGVSWSSLPLCQAYVAMVHEWLWYLAQPGLPKRNLAVGETIAERSESQGVTAELTLPDQRLVPLQAEISPTDTKFQRSVVGPPGAYTLQLKAKDSALVQSKFFVHRNPEESDLKSLSDEDMRQLRSMKEFQIGAELDGLVAGGEIEVPKRAIEGWLLVALAFALLGEILLAGWTNRRRNLRLAPVTMDA